MRKPTRSCKVRRVDALAWESREGGRKLRLLPEYARGGFRMEIHSPSQQSSEKERN